MSCTLDSVLQADLEYKKEQHLYRHRLILDGAQASHVSIAGKPFINFCSNDYLGYANHPRLKKRFKEAVAHYGVGAGSAHLVSGHTHAHHALEEELADFVGRDRALLFSTGYMANLGIASTLMGEPKASRKNSIFEDRLNHASLIDAALLSRSRLKRFLHNDTLQLSQQLQRSQSDRKLIMTDAVFSMDGDIAPLKTLVKIAQQEQAWLMVDDAHGFGIHGDKGNGTVVQQSISQEQLPIYMATLGKAMGGFGAFVAGSEVLIESLIQQARTYIYTTAMPAAMAEVIRESLRLCVTESWRREILQDRIEQFKRGCQSVGIPLLPSNTPIQPIVIGDNHKTTQISQKLAGKGFLITAIRPPTVPKGTARLRITFSADHSKTEVDDLIFELDQALNSHSMGPTGIERTEYNVESY